MLHVICDTEISCEEVGLMELNIKHKQIVILALLLTMLLITLVQGCGNTNGTECTAPAGSTITITPSSQSISGGGIFFPTGLNWTVSVALPDKTPMPKACITVSGTFAVPNGYALYQFQYYPKDVSPNVPVNSGFSAQTDDFGQYTFSTLLSAPSGTWHDTIYVQSGTNSANATVSITD